MNLAHIIKNINDEDAAYEHMQYIETNIKTLLKDNYKELQILNNIKPSYLRIPLKPANRASTIEYCIKECIAYPQNFAFLSGEEKLKERYNKTFESVTVFKPMSEADCFYIIEKNAGKNDKNAKHENYLVASWVKDNLAHLKQAEKMFRLKPEVFSALIKHDKHTLVGICIKERIAPFYIPFSNNERGLFKQYAELIADEAIALKYAKQHKDMLVDFLKSKKKIKPFFLDILADTSLVDVSRFTLSLAEYKSLYTGPRIDAAIDNHEPLYLDGAPNFLKEYLNAEIAERITIDFCKKDYSQTCLIITRHPGVALLLSDDVLAYKPKNDLNLAQNILLSMDNYAEIFLDKNFDTILKVPVQEIVGFYVYDKNFLIFMAENDNYQNLSLLQPHLERLDNEELKILMGTALTELDSDWARQTISKCSAPMLAELLGNNTSYEFTSEDRKFLSIIKEKSLIGSKISKSTNKANTLKI